MLVGSSLSSVSVRCFRLADFLPPAGAVYVYTLTNDAWTFYSKLVPHNGQAGQSFGHDVTLCNDGNSLLVGSPTRTISGDSNRGEL